MPVKATCAVIMAMFLFVAFMEGCSIFDFDRQPVAMVNGEVISVLEVREYLGASAGVFRFAFLPMDYKRGVVDQLIAVRLVVQAGKAMGIDNTLEFKNAVKNGETAVIADAFTRMEMKKKIRLKEKEVKEEAGRIKEEKEGISEAEAMTQAFSIIAGRQIQQIQNNLIDTAQKETDATINYAVLEQIGKGEDVPDDAVIASAGKEKILYGDVRKVLKDAPMFALLNSQDNSEMIMALIYKILEQDIVLRALKAYAEDQGLEKTETYKISVANIERVVIANMVFDKVAVVPEVSDEEVMEDYNRRVKIMRAQGENTQAPPSFAAVKEQIREVLQNYKRQGAFEEYINRLRNQGKVTVYEDILKRV